jgi:hypothetical protein
MSLSTALLRFADAAEVIRSRSVTDHVLRDLCKDYGDARAMLSRLKRKRPLPTMEIEEYTSLAAELEDEIIQRLLGSGTGE